MFAYDFSVTVFGETEREATEKLAEALKSIVLTTGQPAAAIQGRVS